MSPLAFPLLNYLHSKNWLHYFLLFWLTLFFDRFFFINSPLLLTESNHYFGIDVHEHIFTPLPNRDSLGFERMFLEYFLGAICARLFLDDKLITNPKLDHFCFAFLAIGIAILDSRYDIFVFLAGVYLMISRTNNFLKIFFRTKAMRFLGKISFSTYVIHLMIIKELKPILSNFSIGTGSFLYITAVITCATFSWYLFENRLTKILNQILELIFNKLPFLKIKIGSLLWSKTS